MLSSSLGFLAIAGFLLLPVTIIIFIVAALRGDHDESGKRGYAVYLGTASFVSMIVLLVGLYTTVNGFTQLARADNSVGSAISGDVNAMGTASSSLGSIVNRSSNHPSAILRTGPFGHHNPGTDAAWRTIVEGILVSLVAGALFLYHRRRIANLRTTDGFANSGADRALQAHAYLCIFTGIVFLIGGATSALYNLFQIGSPTVFSAADRGDAFAKLAKNLFVALEAVGIFWLYCAYTFLGPIRKKADTASPTS